jgi:hypothetical protein
MRSTSGELVLCQHLANVHGAVTYLQAHCSEDRLTRCNKLLNTDLIEFIERVHHSVADGLRSSLPKWVSVIDSFCNLKNLHDVQTMGFLPVACSTKVTQLIDNAREAITSRLNVLLDEVLRDAWPDCKYKVIVDTIVNLREALKALAPLSTAIGDDFLTEFSGRFYQGGDKMVLEQVEGLSDKCRVAVDHHTYKDVVASLQTLEKMALCEFGKVMPAFEMAKSDLEQYCINGADTSNQILVGNAKKIAEPDVKGAPELCRNLNTESGHALPRVQ